MSEDFNNNESRIGIDSTPPGPLRVAFSAELDQLRLQVELMAVRVDQNLERSREVLMTGDQRTAQLALTADDEVDAMAVSLTERCYQLLAREGPVASDLRFIVSVLRVLGEFERVGDLALRVVIAAREQAALTNPVVRDLLIAMADSSIERYSEAVRAWSAASDELATKVINTPSITSHLEKRLYEELEKDEGPGSGARVITALSVGRSYERVADHASVISARLLFMVTGDSSHLAGEVR